MIRTILYLLFINLLIWLRPGIGGETLTLADCLKRAYESNHLLRAASLQVISSEEQLKSTEAQRLPAVNLSSLYMRVGKVSSFEFSTSPGSAPMKLSFGTPNRVNLDLKLQMPLFTWRRISGTVALAENGRNLSELQKDEQKLSVTDQVLRAYFALLLNKEVVGIQQENIERTKVYLAATQKRFDSGQLPKLELLRAQVQLTNEQNDLETALGNTEKSKLFLAKTVGLQDDDIDVAGALKFYPIAIDKSEIIQQALENRVDLRVLDIRKAMGDNQITVSSSGNKPNLFLFSGYNVTNGFDPMDPNRFVDNWNVGVQLSWPLFDGFKTKHEVESARINRQVTDLQEKEIKEMLVVQIKQALVNLNQSEIKINSQKKNIELAKEALEMSVKQYEQGFISSLDLVDAQKVLLRNELGQVQAIFNHIMTKIDLSKAIGNYQWFEFEVN
jgi:outer membrane protein